MALSAIVEPILAAVVRLFDPTTPNPFSKDGKRLINGGIWMQYVDYRKAKYQEYQEIVTKTAPLRSKRKEQDQRYKLYVEDIEFKNKIKLGQRVTSPLFAGYGLAVIASASVSTALLSIERNTRKD